MNRWQPGAPALVLVLLLAAGLTWLLWPSAPAHAPLEVTDVMAGSADPRFARVTAPRPFHFPADHDAHPAYRSEWWYLTGNLLHTTANEQVGHDPRRYGFQFTLFRQAMQPQTESRSGWLSPQLYLAHLALTDLARGEHVSHERLSREGPGLAGAENLRFWLYDWQLSATTAKTLFPAVLKAVQGEQGLDLSLTPVKPRVFQGERGFSRKNAAVGNASYYYSYPRLAVSGRIKQAGDWLPVKGEAWFDHEWSSSALAEHQLGWDWFAIQLNDGRELMLYRFRNRDNYHGPSFNTATLVEADGSSRVLDSNAVNYLPGKPWTSKQTAKVFPTRWRVKIPELGMALTIKARIDNQEMVHSLTYWEGSIEVSGSHSGQGYLEMTGY